jgi:hypothetical protein
MSRAILSKSRKHILPFKAEYTASTVAAPNLWQMCQKGGAGQEYFSGLSFFSKMNPRNQTETLTTSTPSAKQGVRGTGIALESSSHSLGIAKATTTNE